MLGEMTVSMLRGEQGFQHKEISKLLEWLKNEDKPDVISLPYTLLLGLANPSRNLSADLFVAPYKVRICFLKVCRSHIALNRRN
jgi:hypothetical protein